MNGVRYRRKTLLGICPSLVDTLYFIVNIHLGRTVVPGWCQVPLWKSQSGTNWNLVTCPMGARAAVCFFFYLDGAVFDVEFVVQDSLCL